MTPAGDPRLARLAGALGPEVIRLGADIPDRHAQDWSGLPPVMPLALALPGDTAEVSRPLALAGEMRLGVVPQGGPSGISGGAHPVPGTIALSTARLNRILTVIPTWR